ncbi:HAD family hydrolase [Thalassomonas haliotis]|uniref:HAD-IB family hydrolase n=1 Tax=Thalassomonas haliotis TaxID=485448 RepID=A0ABY7VDT2_9GAMM|nr:HAD-IB family hydrolase [Thalassomonas haliotis]WDE11565.1 HAD-IB family hydrolase [Thalassomonas haliotis]
MWQHNLVTTEPCAFFDVDNTLISIKSMFSFLDFLQQNSNLISAEFMVEVQTELSRLFADKERRENINEFYYCLFRDVSVASLAEQGRLWFESVVQQEDFFHSHALTRLRQHQAQGYNIVFVSGSGLAMLEPLADMLAVNAILCAPQAQHQAQYTGELYDRPCIGEGKAHYIRQFLSRFSDVAARSIAYGDDISDFPMLETVGQGCLVSPGDNAIAANAEKGFSVLEAGLAVA